MSRQAETEVTGLGVTGVVGVDINMSPVNVSAAVILSPDAVLKYTVEHTYHDLWSPHNPEDVTWFPFIVDQTSNADGYYAYPVSGVRARVTEYTSGSLTLKVLQAGI
jgi:hypothetical protein